MLLLLCSACAAAVVDESASEPGEQCLPPWEFSRTDSIHRGAPPERPVAASPDHLALSILMRTYKSVFSPVGGRRCGMYPSCSSYAWDAIRSRGTPVGVAMACDRLLRCGNDPRFYRFVRNDGRVLRSDPADNACRSSD